MSTTYCRHLKVNGERCGSPAVAHKIFCYFHSELERRHSRLNRRVERTSVFGPELLQNGLPRDPTYAEQAPTLDLPPLEDRHSIQVALSMVITALAKNRIDSKQAALLFYGLQVASSNAHRLNPIPKRTFAKVTHPVLDNSLSALIAPDEDPEDAVDEVKGSVTLFLEKMQLEYAEKDRLKAEADAKTIADAIAEVTAVFNACSALTPQHLLDATSRVEAAAASTITPAPQRY